MDKCSIHVRHTLKNILQTLAQIMAVSQAHTLIKHYVYLNVKFIASMVCLQALDFLDCAREAHGQVEKDITVGGWCRGTSEMTDVSRRSDGPIEHDIDGEKEAS